jgi:hypothetical protein
MPTAFAHPDVCDTIAAPLAPDLASIVAPVPPDVFLREYWRQQPLFVPGDAARLVRLATDLGSGELGALLAQHRSIDIWREGAVARELPATSKTIDMALECYHNAGATLYFHLRRDTPAHAWAFRLAHEVGELPNLVTCSILAVRAGHGSKPHYDRNENFTIQLSGRKRWLVAVNDFVTAPVANWAVGTVPPPYADPARVPSQMPADAVEYVLGPGSMLYVPRGYLHHVTALDEDSLSLTITFSNLLWGEALLDVLKRRLLQHLPLRQALTGAFGSGWNREPTRLELDACLDLLRREAAALTADDCRDLLSPHAKPAGAGTAAVAPSQETTR